MRIGAASDADASESARGRNARFSEYKAQMGHFRECRLPDISQMIALQSFKVRYG